MQAKNRNKEIKFHSDDIHSLAVSSDRKLVCTGQVGYMPTIMVWNSLTAEHVKGFKLPKGSRSVTAVGFSYDMKYIAAADLHDNHNVNVFDVTTGELLGSEKSGPDKVFDLCWSGVAGEQKFCTVATKSIHFWDLTKGKVSKKRGTCGKGISQTC